MSAWPVLPYAQWRDTCETLHLWTQVIGKLALAMTPLVNHHWNVAFRLTARGFATQAMHLADGRSLTAEFDFIEHELALRCSDGGAETIALEPMTVADFHAAVMAALARIGVQVHIWTMPSEIEDAIPFERDTIHRAYDAAWANTFWSSLVCMRPAFEEFRARFVGKSSPLHFFWGSFDLALTRFSGRRAASVPEGVIEREAYSHEVISHGFWPGNAGGSDAAFYAYAKPEPDGFRQAIVRPREASYDEGFGIFVLPYEHVRSAASPEAELMTFLETTYEAAARLAMWDRESLER
jgi:hypothetical protein